MNRVLSSLLIVLGVLLIFSSFISKRIVKTVNTTSQNIFEEVTVEEIEENLEREADFDYEAIKDVEITSSIRGLIGFDNKSVIGQIIIEDLNMSLPILKGISNSNLLAGAATMVEGQIMGKGNYPLAGHYMKDKNLLFGSLLDIELGTRVKITDKKMVYEYEIYDIVIVDDTAFYMLEQDRAYTRGKPIISLMTCYYTSKNGKRFFALGELVDKYTYRSDIVEI